jgi:hypothetical protein
MYLTIISITIILVASIVLITLPEFGNSGIAQGQGNNMTSPSLTPQQKAAMCDPNDKFVNDTESSVCGIPPTQQPRQRQQIRRPEQRHHREL